MCSGSAAGLQKRLLGRHRHGRAAVDIQYLVRYLKKLKNPMNIRSKCPYPPLATTCLISRCRCWQLSRTSGQSSASPLTSWSPWRRTSPRSSAAASGSSPTVSEKIFLVHFTYPLSVGGGINPAACTAMLHNLAKNSGVEFSIAEVIRRIVNFKYSRPASDVCRVCRCLVTT